MILLVYSLLIFRGFCHETCSQPADCSKICPFGYLRDENQRCICQCAEDACQSVVCRSDEICIATGSRASCFPRAQQEQRTECPRLIGGVCALRCERDADCQGRLICCSNGCGRECVVPMSSFAIRAESATPIAPVVDPLNRIISVVKSLPDKLNSIFPYPVRPADGQIPQPNKHRLGQCPHQTVDLNCRESTSQCSYDSDCPGVQKCCISNCGNRCFDPIKTSACIHLSMAVRRLPEQHLMNGYVPSCEHNGKFTAIQCTRTECWCVDVNFGSEIPGTREAVGMRRPDMCLNSRKCFTKCDSSHCPHGLLLDESGCPVEGCLCHDICHGVKCSNSGDSCQLVEPDCARPPCLPVPRCLINACPLGNPMALQTGVTALCASDEQCSDGFWCQQVGYNGLGFCCMGVKPSVKEEKCPARQPQKDGSCASSCKVDDDCPTGKCCFDGCGLSCMEMKFKPIAVAIRPMSRLKSRYQPGEIAKHNKERLSSLVADCPDLPAGPNCTMECKADGDCPGMRRCCRAGCGSRCAHFSKTTPCFHTALTAEVYSLRSARKCDIAGNFEHKQCDDNFCYCVDIFSGEEVPGTRTETVNPNCDIKKCESIECQIQCLYGFEKDSDGCKTCKCRNPCLDVKCPQGSSCIMSSVECYQKENCPAQPRCVLNVCPVGEAAVSPIGVAEICHNDSQCPKSHWCHDVGISSGGACCPLPSRPIRPGTCPSIEPQLETHGECRLECRADDDCPMERKCCFDGCATICLEVIPPTEPSTTEIVELEKPGNCPHFDVRQCSFKERNNECTKDSNCVGVQKCCSDGCRKVCVYPERNTACLLLKGAFQQIGLMNFVKCRPDGSFEEVQCSADFCWCVDQNGAEVEGTRTSEDIQPSCAGRRCQVPLCVNKMDCKFGFRKDSNGCNTCECRSPCDGVTCPNSAVCIPMQAECDDPPCIEVPRCVVNPCAISSPILDPSSFEPIQCKDSNQCIGSKTASYCQVFSPETGYCCPGPEPRSHPGTCPAITQPSGDCTRHCVLDEQCPSDHKCCSNGCGLTCQPAEFQTSVHTNVRLGECMKIPTIGAFCSQRQKSELCVNDGQCPQYHKCCFDGCGSRCFPPAVTTQCIHAYLAATDLRQNNPSIFIPECDSNGEFQQIQQHYGLRWCVDLTGDETPGTKTTKQPNCRYPRSCPVRSCAKNCPFGFKTDNDGCVVCDCRAPCEMVDCPAGSVCRVVAHTCLSENCHPVARCVPNMCPSGEPLVIEGHGVLEECDADSPCPAGYSCKNSGFMSKGYCCPSRAEQISGVKCSPLPPMNNSIDGSPCAVTCRFTADCPQASCCYNGCGTSCQFEISSVATSTSPRFSSLQPLPRPPSRTAPITPINSQIDMPPELGGNTISGITVGTPIPDRVTVIQAVPVTTIPPIPVSLKTSPAKVGVCPTPLLNPGCKEECLTDYDCPGFHKCCKASCAARCVAPAIVTACIHKLLFYFKESPSLPPPVQCSDDGLFRQHQCDIKTKQCWCADKSNGKEIMGTRRTSELPLMDCSQSIYCPTTCAEVEPLCPFGLRLDAVGCPFSGICSCANPCENIQCTSPLARCTLVMVSCLGTSCPPVPKCVPNLCGLNSMQLDDYGNPKSCQSDKSCASGRCVIEEYEDGEKAGICCQDEMDFQEPKRQQIVTNCSLSQSAIDRLYNNGASTTLLKPRCADVTALFTTVQCDPSGTCWCVDQVSGVEVHGTRKANPLGQNVCSSPRICSNSCNAGLCPFGLKLDRFGCPSIECACYSPCDQVSCAKGRICLLRSAVCKSNNCLPVPVCEQSPCLKGAQPAMDVSSRRPFGCDLAHSSCPSGYSCTIVTAGEGFCCPIDEPLNSPVVKPVKTKKTKESRCPHGDPFAGTSDGAPFTCTSTGNGCPSTHYCVTKAGREKGICCVAKRYVCNLRRDRGPCSLSVPRFYYSNKTCHPFNYGGCSGNLNNFATAEDCEDFCEGVGLDFSLPMMDDMDLPMETLQLGFSLTGPQLTRDKQIDVQKSVLSVLANDFKIPESVLSNVQIKDDNSIRFTVTAPEAREYSRKISDAVSTGRLAFEIDDFHYKVEPHTWFAHHHMENSTDNSTAWMILWGALLAAAVCGLFIACCSCVACIYHYKSETKDQDSLRGSTPSNFVSNSIVAHRVQPRLRREMVFSREDLHEEEHYRRVERRPPRRTTSTFRSVERPNSTIYF